MIYETLRNKRVLLGVGILFVVCSILWLWYSLFIFHITKVSPPGDVIPTSQKSITIVTNMSIASADINSEKSFSKSIEDKIINLNFSDDLEEGNTLQFEILLKSKSGQTIKKSFNFTAQFVPTDQLDEVESEKQAAASNSFEDLCPVAKKLPFITSTYELSYEFPDMGQTTMKIIYLDKAFDDSTEPTEASLAELRKNINEAKAWLDSNGYEDKSCTLYFWQPYLLDEFNARYYDPDGETGD